MIAMGCTFLEIPPALETAFSERGRYDIDLQVPGGYGDHFSLSFWCLSHDTPMFIRYDFPTL
jgi:hypothetical protein